MVKRWKAEVWMEEETEGFNEEEFLTVADLNEAFRNAKKVIVKGWEGFRVVNFDVHEDKEVKN